MIMLRLQAFLKSCDVLAYCLLQVYFGQAQVIYEKYVASPRSGGWYVDGI